MVAPVDLALSAGRGGALITREAKRVPQVRASAGETAGANRHRGALVSAGRLCALALLAYCGLVVAALDVFAQTGRGTPVIPPQLQALPGQPEPHGPEERKIHSQLLAAMAAEKRGMPAAGTAPIELDIVAQVSDALLNKIRQLGGRTVNAFPADHVIRARMPLAQIGAFAADPGVISVHPAVRARTNAATEGDIAHEADLARQKSLRGADGTGVKVCVISDSNDDGNGALQHAEDIRAIDAQTTTVLTDRRNGKVQDGMAEPSHTGEGLAMMEIIHQLAPGASIEFATGFPNQSQMAQNIGDLANDGCHIIVDDISWPDELPFQEDIVGKAVREVTARGISYFSSAANMGNVISKNASAWEGQFVDSGYSLVNGPGHLHQFAPPTDYVEVIAESGRASDTITLSWNDPAGSPPTNLYDLYVKDSLGDPVASSTGAAAQRSRIVDLQNVSNHPKLRIGDRIYIVKTPSAAAKTLRLDTGGARIAHHGSTASVWVGLFVDSGHSIGSPSPGNYHEFPARNYVEVTAQSGRVADAISLFWNDPVLSPPAHVPNQYDLHIADSTGGIFVSSAGPSAYARQVIDLSHVPTRPKLLVGDRIYVVKTTSAAPLVLHVDTSGAAISPATWGRIRGHNASPAPFAYAIAAQPVGNPAVPFVANEGVARLSADGPRRMYFYPDGRELTPGRLGPNDGFVVLKPDFTAAEGVRTTLPVGSNLDVFHGSSAAAPHAAAIAALVLSKYPSLTPGRLRYVLSQSALPNGETPWNLSAGRGTLMASRAMAEAKRIAEEQHLLNNGVSSILLTPEGTVLDKRMTRDQSIYGTAPPALADVTKLSMSGTHAVALRRNGTVATWRAISDAIVQTSMDATLTIPDGLSDVIDVAAGFHFTVAVKKDGTVVGWGDPTSPASGAGIPFALQPGLTDIRSVTAQSEGTAIFKTDFWAAIKVDGSLARWDREGNPLPMPPIRDAVTLGIGVSEGAALTFNGTVVTWPWDNPGVFKSVPGAVGITAIAAGDGHTLALRRDGTVMAWTCSGCLNDAGAATVPPGLSNVIAVAADGDSSFALKSDGSIVAWGWQR